MKNSRNRVPVESATLLSDTVPQRWMGQLCLPGQAQPSHILIFPMPDGYVALRAECPHEGHSLVHCRLHGNDTLVCPAHGRRIGLLDSGFHACREQESFFIPLSDLGQPLPYATGNPHAENPAATASRLQHEIDQLTLANFKKERQIVAITHGMDAMLRESEQKKQQLEELVVRQQGLARFIGRVMDSMDGLLVVVDTDGRIRQVNTAILRELEFDAEELLGQPFDDLLAPADREKLAARLPALSWPVRSAMLENIRLDNGYAAEHWLSVKGAAKTAAYLLKGSLLHSDQGKLEGAVISGTNISLLKEREMKLRLSAKVFENSGEAIFITDADAVILETNAAFTAITGYDKSEVVGRNPRLLKSGRHDRRFYEQMWHDLVTEGSWRGEMWDRRKNREIYPVWLTINALADERGVTSHYVAIFSDISTLKQTEQKLEQLAYYDPLTTLPNRSLFKNRLEHECLLAQRNQTRLAVFFIDLDRFKNINDTLGHWAGDCLLQEVAARIQTCVRKSDTVARLGGDEFTIILSGLDEAQEAAEIAQKILQVLELPVPIDNHHIYVGASIGISLYPDDGDDFTVLTKHADAAMYAAKAKGRGTFQYFEARMNVEAQQRIELETKLHRALEDREFELHYQPKADAGRGAITGAEALIRWHHPPDGVIPPDKFIPVAEETGFIHVLGRWILRTACMQAKAWADRFCGIRIAVNLSAKQLLADDFIADLDKILEETGVSPRWIELEITESVVMHDIDTATHRLRSIAGKGIRIAMDDFGTGYSSLSYLRKLPVQVLKIDRSFIRDYRDAGNTEVVALIKTVIALGHSLNMRVVAEGVETQQQLELLNAHACDEIQGYLLSRPLPAAQFEEFYAEFSNLAERCSP
ncbi:MAG TPA: EAL domain-containing protein [Methylococcaceae bacterium]|nr:EAL domain-containing protein [Methylococcaceae bacterium]